MSTVHLKKDFLSLIVLAVKKKKFHDQIRRMNWVNCGGKNVFLSLVLSIQFSLKDCKVVWTIFSYVFFLMKIIGYFIV